MDIQAIENYIKENGRVEMSDVQERFSLTYSEVNKTFENLEKKGVIKYCGGLSYEFVQEKYGGSDNVDDCKEDNKNVGDDNEDEDFNTTQARREYIEKRRRELIERMQRMEQEDAANDEQKEGRISDDIRADLNDEVEKMPGYNGIDSTFSIKMNVSYPNGKPFRIKVVEDDDGFYVSDCGNTLEYLSEFNDRDALAEFFRKSLWSENVRFLGNAVCTTIDNIHDLTGECSFLMKVVNGLITMEHFDMYYLGEDLLNLASNILEMDNVELIVQALEILGEKAVRISSLKRELHIGYATAGRLLDKLIELDIIDGTSHIKKMEISQGFVEYLKRMLAEKLSM